MAPRSGTIPGSKHVLECSQYNFRFEKQERFLLATLESRIGRRLTGSLGLQPQPEQHSDSLTSHSFVSMNMMANLLFDFGAYLRVLDPDQAYDIEHLTTGNCNLVVRATKLAISGSSRFPAQHSNPKALQAIYTETRPRFSSRSWQTGTTSCEYTPRRI
jgi:hypothetical protein